MATAKQVIVPINFDAIARQTGLVKALKDTVRVESDFKSKIQVAFRQAVDAARQHNGTGETACNALYSEIMKSEFAKAFVEDAGRKVETLRNYSTGAKRALHFNLDWEASLFTKTDVYPFPWSTKKAASKAGTTTGTVKTTDRSELDKTLSKALAQARLLGLVEFSAVLVDLLVDRLEGFKEVEAK
jgi:hypothetical protein